jgi:hypothetical protein
LTDVVDPAFKLQCAAVRRYILLILLVVLPLQTTWATVAYCPRGEHQDVHAVASSNTTDPEAGHQHIATTHGHHGHLHGHHGTAGHSGVPSLDCSLFQFVAVEPLDIMPQPIPAPNVAVAGVALLRFNSHIPDGLDRPNWRFAA